MPTTESRSAHDAAVAFNARLGVVLFLLYLIIYTGFIYLNAFRRDVMAAEAFDGVNVAVVYGFGLIFAAFALAIVYMILCRHGGDKDSALSEGGK